MGRLPAGKTIDYGRLGSFVIQSASVILAIRTARREAVMQDVHASVAELEREIDHALSLAVRLVSVATARHAQFFEQQAETFTTGVVQDDVPL